MKKGEIFNTQVVFVYERDINIRKKQFEFEDELNDLFRTPFISYGIPDDQDGNIPRFESNSINGFSKLQVNQYRTNLITNYDEKYRESKDHVKDYISERASRLKDVLSSQKCDFVAFIVELGYQFGDEENLNDYLKRINGAKCINSKTNDFSILYSKEFKDDYYLNIRCSKYSIPINNKNDERMSNKGISVIIDLNSKFSKTKEKNHDFNFIEDLKEETFELLETLSLEDYLQDNIT